MLALTVLVAPGAQATDDAPPVTIAVVQDETWWEGGGERGLAATAVGPDGEPVTGHVTAVLVATPTTKSARSQDRYFDAS
ncbi:hypothetical protein ATJ88_0183 [Isoptericola jiangsuensis]|uniref:Uncharacterized protein n=1 Tax=Isoptericola jiangsuensis TaxID=548579 RepID=A0A2A9ESN3_9MICO|nr:hypothetical protein [Isoptericola jiangsuensis]PFG41541.1 hypothetical protein ATJ88_0183 [Isoptericola jiangsuensis]